jgi:hypothetical protein
MTVSICLSPSPPAVSSSIACNKATYRQLPPALPAFLQSSTAPTLELLVKMECPFLSSSDPRKLSFASEISVEPVGEGYAPLCPSSHPIPCCCEQFLPVQTSAQRKASCGRSFVSISDSCDSSFCYWDPVTARNIHSQVAGTGPPVPV